MRHLGRAADVAANPIAAPEKAESVRLAYTRYSRHDGVMALDTDCNKTLDFHNTDGDA